MLSYDVKVEKNEKSQDKVDKVKPRSLTLTKQEILFQNEHYIVIEKPPDLRMDGGNGMDYTVQNSLISSIPGTTKENFKWIHQLDYATSGVLAVALTKEAASVACQSFAMREVSKVYLALLEGRLDLNKYQIISYTDLQNKKASLLKKCQSLRENSTSKSIHSKTRNQDISSWQDIEMNKSLKLHFSKLHEFHHYQLESDIINEVNKINKNSNHLDNISITNKNCSTSSVIDSCGDSDFNEIQFRHLMSHTYEEFTKSSKLRKLLRKFLKSNNMLKNSDVIQVIDKVIDENEQFLTSEPTCLSSSDYSIANENIGNISDAYQIATDIYNTDACHSSFHPRIFDNIIEYQEFINTDCVFVCTDIPIHLMEGFSQSNSDNNEAVLNTSNTNMNKINNDTNMNYTINDDKDSKSNLITEKVLVILTPLTECKTEFLMNIGFGSHITDVLDRDYYQCESWLKVREHAFYQDRPITKVELKLLTGRRHQLRVHSLCLGHPIVNDVTYDVKLHSDFSSSTPHMYSQKTINTSNNNSELYASNSSSNTQNGHEEDQLIPFHYRDNNERMMLHSYKLKIPLPSKYKPNSKSSSYFLHLFNQLQLQLQSQLANMTSTNRAATKGIRPTGDMSKTIQQCGLASVTILDICAEDPFTIHNGSVKVLKY